MDRLLMGAEEGIRGKTWWQIEDRAAKIGGEGGKTGGKTCKTNASKEKKTEGAKRGNISVMAEHFKTAMDEDHAHVCISPQCGNFFF